MKTANEFISATKTLLSKISIKFFGLLDWIGTLLCEFLLNIDDEKFKILKKLPSRLMGTVVIFLCFLLLLLFIMLMGIISSDKKENKRSRPLNPNVFEESTDIPEYYLFPPGGSGTKADIEYHISPESVEAGSVGIDLGDEFLDTGIFDRDDEIIQVELNRLKY